MTISKMAAAWVGLLPLRDRVDREETARGLDVMFDRVRRETVEACAAWLWSKFDRHAEGWRADALRASDELAAAGVQDVLDAFAEENS